MESRHGGIGLGTADAGLRTEPAGTSPERGASRQAARPAPSLTLNVEVVAWGVVLAIAAGLRLLHLGRPLPDTAEALRARAAWDFANGGSFAAWTGDMTSALAALLIRVGDDRLDWVRLPNAVFGVLSVMALALLRSYLGRAVPLVGALLLAVSPVGVAVSRTLNPDAAGLLCGLIILVVTLRISEGGDARAWPLLVAMLGVALGVGGVAVALVLVAATHGIIEVFWLDRGEVAERWRALRADRRGLAASGLLFLAGLLLAVMRFGAGPERLSVAAFADWTPPHDAGSVLPAHAPLSVGLGYEPVVLALGVAGGVVLGLQWARAAASITVGERLLVEWATVGLLLTLVVLHHRPGQLLVFGLPVMLLAGHRTLGAISSLASLRWRESLPVLTMILVIAGYLSLRLLEWTEKPDLPDTRATLGALALLAVAAGMVVWVLFSSPGAAPGVLTAGTWVLGGWVALHGAAAVAGRSGDEYLFGTRPEPLRSVLVREVDLALAKGQQVAVERHIAAAMAWELRGRDVQVYEGLPPRSGLALAPVASSRAEEFTPSGLDIAVERRWYPVGWDVEGAVRWLAYRNAWGPSETLRATTMISTSSRAPSSAP